MNKHVAISEEYANDPSNKVKSGGLLFDRRVSRIITPGTLIDEKFMDPWENNFLLSIHHQTVTEEGTDPVQNVGLAWLDLSSGDFFTQMIQLSALPSAIARISPREIVMDKRFEDEKIGILASLINQGHHTVTYHEKNLEDDGSRWTSQFDDPQDPYIEKFTGIEVEAGTTLLQYVNQQLLGNVPKLRPPIQRQNEEFMTIDKNSLQALEIRETLKDGALEGSLLHTVRRTVTKSGTRLLSQRLTSPSASLEEINERHGLVTEFLSSPELRQEICSLLRTTFDTWRLLQKFSFGRGLPDDLIALARTIQATIKISSLLKDHVNGPDVVVAELNAVDRLAQKLELGKVNLLSKNILEAIDEDKLSEQHSIEDDEAVATVQLAATVLREAGESDKIAGVPARVRQKLGATTKEKAIDTSTDVWIMRPGASPSLQNLHTNLEELLNERDVLQANLREQSKVSTLLLKWSPGLGHFCYVKGKSSGLDSIQGARRVSLSRSTASYHLPEWSHLGGRIEDVKLRIRTEEQNIFVRLRDQVIQNMVALRRNAAVLDELDVACSFALLAEEKHWVRPILNRGASHHIIGGRHPTVEAGLGSDGRLFTSNDCIVGDDHRILLITGPNMAGKSTYLRQNALISILAQTGSYVPADYASIGIVDKIFSRVGSADNLYQDQSTFMVEMLETADILKQATPRSFVIMDEVGRGTTPEDGVAVGYAALHHLYHVNRSRTLFATHFHALADMTASWEGLECHCTDVSELEDGGFTYAHKLRPGVNRQSHALKVARLAGKFSQENPITDLIIAQDFLRRQFV
jgi:DNA mismatch repair ATPase MutS